MSTPALITITITYLSVTLITIYFFVKVFRTPNKNPKEDSYSETN